MLQIMPGAIEKSLFPSVCVVDQVVRNNQAAAGATLADSTDSIDRKYLFHPGMLECPNVGAIIDKVRRNILAITVASQEYDRLATKLPVHQAT